MQEFNIILNKLDRLFSRQLPNMGTIYISRLVFDVEAFCVSLIHEGRAHGAICVRIFKKEEFIEISFCAVDYEYQSRGYGRLLMDFLKCYVQNIGIFDDYSSFYIKISKILRNR